MVLRGIGFVVLGFWEGGKGFFVRFRVLLRRLRVLFKFIIIEFGF